jgi:integrase
MISGGVPLKVVSEILGHSSIAITDDISGHVSPDVARQAIDLLGNTLDR